MRYVMFLMIGLFVAFACKGAPVPVNDSPVATSGNGEQQTTGDVEVTCPVCGLSFMSGEAVGKYEYSGELYYFLTKDHLENFKQTPDAYAKAAK